MTTIKIGIDLGTTNSSVAVNNQNNIHAVKNIQGEESTPSVVYADRNANIQIGSKAKYAINRDREKRENTKSEIKRLMGTCESIFFPNLNKSLLPEEISAEILKSLIGDIKRKFPYTPLNSAVITVPAYFSTVQSEATKRAGELAGFNQVVLLQEPIAAAIAYGFQNQLNENWLVYDLGGGTFDVALVASRDGSLTVLAHAGDNFLGGKDIDDSIIHNLIIPSLTTVGITIDPKIHSDIFKYLKEVSETAKIELTAYEKTTLDIDFHQNGQEIQHSLEITREDLLQACKNILDKTLHLCKKTIDDAQVDPSTVQKIVFVGGPTQMPILRDYLNEELSIQVDGSLDPLTVVAKGAAMFGNQTMVERSDTRKDTEIQNNSCELEINYNPVISEDEQMVTGKLLKHHEASIPHSIKFVSSDDTFSSNEILLKNGKFILTLPTGKTGSQYWIYVRDSKGQLLSPTPEGICINRGISILGAPLPYSIGVSVVSFSSYLGYRDQAETMDFFFEKNSVLPLEKTKRYQTLIDLKSGSSENAVPMCIYEGESHNTNRNTLVCHLAITGKDIARDLKRGSPVDITIKIDESREMTVKAYFPDLDITLDARETLYFDSTNVGELKKGFKEQVSRSESMHSDDQADQMEIVKDMIKNIQTTLDKSESDSDQKRKAEKQIKELAIALDQIEGKTKFNINITAFWKECQILSEYLKDCNPPEEYKNYESIFSTLKNEGETAITKKDVVWIQHIVGKLQQLTLRCQYNDPRYLKVYIESLLESIGEKKEQDPTITNLINRAQEAITKSNVKEMQDVFQDLISVTHDSENPQVSYVKSGITI